MGGVEGAGSPIMLNIRRLKGETKTCMVIFKSVLIIHITTIIIPINVIILILLIYMYLVDSVDTLFAVGSAPTVEEMWKTPLALLASSLPASSSP